MPLTLTDHVDAIVTAATEPMTAREVYDLLPSPRHAPSPLAVWDCLESLEAEGRIEKARTQAGPYAYIWPGYPWANWPRRRLVGEPSPERRQQVPAAHFPNRRSC